MGRAAKRRRDITKKKEPKEPSARSVKMALDLLGIPKSEYIGPITGEVTVKRRKPPNTLGEMTPERRREVQQKGREKAAENRERRKTFKEVFSALLDMKSIEGSTAVESIRKEYPQITNREAIAIAMIAEAVKNGNVRAFTAIRDTTGELPVQTVNVENNKPLEITITTVD